ncbi:hypothetical protein D3C78_1026330 [compost metagenome]
MNLCLLPLLQMNAVALQPPCDARIGKLHCDFNKRLSVVLNRHSQLYELSVMHLHAMYRKSIEQLIGNYDSRLTQPIAFPCLIRRYNSWLISSSGSESLYSRFCMLRMILD